MLKLSQKPRVIIVGAGFGGLQAARALKDVPVEITLIDKNNYHLFQPLLYQVATAGLSAPDIAEPIRGVLKNQKNVEVLMGEVKSIHLVPKTLLLEEKKLNYDYLILAPGAQYNYFGHSTWKKEAPGLKTVEDALLIRRKILVAFEKAEVEEDPQLRQNLLTFVIVGAGPTGVELAGSIAELAHKVLAADFRRINLDQTRIILIEAGPRILGGFAESLAKKAQKKLQQLGVEILLNSKVADIRDNGVKVNNEFIFSSTILWAAGVLASPLIRDLGCETDKMGRAVVQEDLSIPQYPNVFVIGDSACVIQEGKALVGMAPMAKQEGAYVATVIANRLRNKSSKAFHYFDKGQMATVGRNFAIAQIGKKKIAGTFAWLIWLVIHIFYLISFENRFSVFTQWVWNYLTFRRGARVITFEKELSPLSQAPTKTSSK